MPIFDDAGRLVALSEEERCVLPRDWPEIVALYIRVPIARRSAFWPDIWREQVKLHPEWRDYRFPARDIDDHIRYLFTEYTVAELAKNRADEDALRELDVLPSLTRNCLARNGVRSGADVRAMTDRELLSLRNFGIGNLRYARQHFPHTGGE